MGDDDLLILLGSEGDRLDALAAMHGVTASLALAIARRRANGNLNRRVGRQARALRALASALARGFLKPDQADIEAIAELMRRAAAAEHHALPHDRLVSLPQGWQLRGLPINPAALALLAVMRLGEGLQRRLLATGSPRRAMQLRVIRDLERDVLAVARDLKARAITTAAALRRLQVKFATAEPLIGADLAELLGGDDAIAAAIAALRGSGDVRPAA